MVNLQPVIVRAIIEMLGAPKDYIESTMKKYVEKLESEGMKIKKKDLSQAQPQGQLFSCFAELTIEFPRMESVVAFCFDSMPSSIEIIDPDVMQFKSFDFSNTLNDLLARLHEVEMLLKNANGKIELLDRNALELLRNFVSYVVKDRPMVPEEICPAVGVDVKELKPFLDKMVEENRLSSKAGVYFIEASKKA
ncbi:MAG: hypothetical protein AABX47_02965 [Nanoarchaeota archaeon]